MAFSSRSSWDQTQSRPQSRLGPNHVHHFHVPILVPHFLNGSILVPHFLYVLFYGWYNDNIMAVCAMKIHEKYRRTAPVARLLWVVLHVDQGLPQRASQQHRHGPWGTWLRRSTVSGLKEGKQMGKWWENVIQDGKMMEQNHHQMWLFMVISLEKMILWDLIFYLI